MAGDRVRILTDPAVAPDDARIAAALGQAFPAWQRLASALGEKPFGIAASWQYYRDGGSWLARGLRGKKNLVWLAVWNGYATATCYFAARHRADLAELAVPEALRRQAAEAQMVGRMLPIVVEIRSLADVDAVLEVLRYKMIAK